MMLVCTIIDMVCICTEVYWTMQMDYADADVLRCVHMVQP